MENRKIHFQKAYFNIVRQPVSKRNSQKTCYAYELTFAALNMELPKIDIVILMKFVFIVTM